MKQEIEFAKTLEEVKKKARAQQNFITKSEVEEAFSALSLSAQQLEMIYDYLRQNKIGVDEPADADDYLGEEEKNYLDDYLEVLQARGYRVERVRCVDMFPGTAHVETIVLIQKKTS